MGCTALTVQRQGSITLSVSEVCAIDRTPIYLLTKDGGRFLTSNDEPIIIHRDNGRL